MWKTSAASREAKEEEEEKDMVEVKYLARHVGAEVTVAGWVDQLRVHGKVAFMVVRDGTGYVQGVLVKKETPGRDVGAGRCPDPGGDRGDSRASSGRTPAPRGGTRWG